MRFITTITIFISLILISKNSFSQPENNYMDLLVYIVDEEYEKCIKKAEKYMEKDETRRDALPYLYTSMAFYEMSRDHKYSEDYPRAYRNSLSFLSKYRRKDKEYAFKNDAEEFIEKIKFEIAEQVDNYMLTGSDRDLRKIKSLMKKVVRIDPDDIGAQLLMGIHYIYAKDKSTGKKEIKSALEKLNELGKSIQFNEMTASQQYFLKESLIAYYDYMYEIDLSKAKKIFLIGKPYFNSQQEDLLIENYNDYTKALNELNG